MDSCMNLCLLIPIVCLKLCLIRIKMSALVENLVGLELERTAVGSKISFSFDG